MIVFGVRSWKIRKIMQELRPEPDNSRVWVAVRRFDCTMIVIISNCTTSKFVEALSCQSLCSPLCALCVLSLSLCCVVLCGVWTVDCRLCGLWGKKRYQRLLDHGPFHHFYYDPGPFSPDKCKI